MATVTRDRSGSGGAGVVAVSLRNGASFDPQIQGAISSLDFRIQGQGFSVFTQLMGFALRQDGQIYYAIGTGLLPGGTWGTLEATGLTESDFGLCGDRFPGVCPGSGSPDLSDAGSPIDFGYFGANTLGGISAGFSTQVGPTTGPSW